jgi:hypothetical protein
MITVIKLLVKLSKLHLVQRIDVTHATNSNGCLHLPLKSSWGNSLLVPLVLSPWLAIDSHSDEDHNKENLDERECVKSRCSYRRLR